jgi:hypothetical protein
MEPMGFFLGDFLPPLKGKAVVFESFLRGVVVISPAIMTETTAARAKIMVVEQKLHLEINIVIE